MAENATREGTYDPKTSSTPSPQPAQKRCPYCGYEGGGQCCKVSGGR